MSLKDIQWILGLENEYVGDYNQLENKSPVKAEQDILNMENLTVDAKSAYWSK